VLPLQLISCLTMFFRDRAELMKKANGTYFPEEVTMTFLVTFCDLYLFYSCMENIICTSALHVANNLQKLLKWFAQLALAVEYLHSNFVLHRDLKVSDKL
jgi:NIMA (never in mitosis gene a)-related kinase 1/4/5